MKKIKKILIVGLVFTTVMACDDFSDYNTDTKNPREVPAGALFANATKTLFDFMTEINVNVNNFRLWSQQWAQTTYADESNYDLITRNVNGAAWNTLYSDVIRDLREAKVIIGTPEYRTQNPTFDDAMIANQLAMAEVLEVFTWHALVDIFGDIPYTQALTDDITPAYDDDQAIYNNIITRLDAAIATLNGDSGMGAADLVYGGDATQWKKFANSLKLRLALRIAQVDNAKAQTMVLQAIDPANGGVFTSNEDNFQLAYQGSTPNTNPLWVSLIQSGRSDFIAASTLVTPMENLNDPRLPFYFQDTFGGNYVGGVYGDNNAYNAFSHPGLLQEDPEFPGIILSYWEVQFLLADAAARGYAVGATPDVFYNEGIRASMLYWGSTALPNTPAITDANITAYLAQPGVAYATAPGTPLQKIAFQKWVSLYDQGFEAWNTVRIYDYPTLPMAVLSELPTPKRYTYPVTEYSLNEDNVAAAGDAMGSDALDTAVFWDN
jgi:hypothetical protein